jgi:hypothetical protein
MLTHFFCPIYIDILFVGDGFDQFACTRALISRTSEISLPQHLLDCGYRNNSLDLKIYSWEDPKQRPVPHLRQETSSFWYLGMSKPGYIIQGFKKGSKKPVKNQAFALSLQSSLSREYIFKNIFRPLTDQGSSFASYLDAKIAASNYQLAKAHLFVSTHFCDWPVRCSELKKHRESLL